MLSGHRLTFLTVHAAVLLYVLAILLQLLARRRGRGIPLARCYWTAGCILLFVHVACAMHFFYAWDHPKMVAQTARQTAAVTGVHFPGGAYVNYAFMLVWALDVITWWVRGDQRYRRRPVWLTIIVHAFLAFIAFNAVVVFATSPAVRRAGIAACVVIAIALVLARRPRNPKGSP